MNELKKYLGAFALSVTVLFSLAGIIAGAVTAHDRAEKVIFGKDYAVLTFGDFSEYKNESEENGLYVDLSFLKNIEKIEKILPYTPFGAVWALIKETMEGKER